MKKTANQGGESTNTHKASLDINLDPLNQQPLCLWASRQERMKARRVRARKGWGTFQCHGNQVDRYLQAAGLVTMNKEGPPAKPGNAALLAKTHPQEQPHVLPDVPALLCHSVSQAQGEEQLRMCFLSTL